VLVIDSVLDTGSTWLVGRTGDRVRVVPRPGRASARAGSGSAFRSLIVPAEASGVGNSIC
jgi:hypothetical protein